MNPLIQPLVRRAILDLLTDIGGEQNEDYLSLMLTALGHPIARRDVLAEMKWLGEQGLLAVEEMEPFHVARILADGRDVANGKLVVEGVWRHKTGE